MFSNQTSLLAEHNGTGHSGHPRPHLDSWSLLNPDWQSHTTLQAKVQPSSNPDHPKKSPCLVGNGEKGEAGATKKRWVCGGIGDVAPPLGSDRQPVTYLRDKASQRGDRTRPRHGNRLFRFLLVSRLCLCRVSMSSVYAVPCFLCVSQQSGLLAQKYLCQSWRES